MRSPARTRTCRRRPQRLTLLLQLARDEAIVRNRPVTFEATPERYHFLVRNETRWDPIVGDDLLRERDFKNGPLTLVLDPASAGTVNPLRITFGREPVDKPFVLVLSTGGSRVAIRADGVGHFTVE